MRKLGIVGASGPAGSIVAERAAEWGFQAIRCSRQKRDGDWHSLDDLQGPIENWVYLAAIWSAKNHFLHLDRLGARTVLFVSSTSKFTKAGDPSDWELAEKLEGAENEVKAWAAGRTVAILRPTLIYGKGSIANLVQVKRIVEKVGFFPIAGPGSGKRQPISTSDLAVACLQAISANATGEYNIGGGQVLTYREMVREVMRTMGKTPRTPSIPMWVFHVLSAVARLRHRHWTPGMARRMNMDMTFDNHPATTDFGFRPGPFVLHRADLEN